MRELNLVKQELRTIKTDINSLNRQTVSSIPGEFQIEICRELKALQQEVSHVRESMYKSSTGSHTPIYSSIPKYP